MKRLIYAPKVWIFIRSSNLDGRIYDVTSDVVRGSVTQNLGDLSSCRFELRNRFHKWLRAANWDNRLIFRPMDLVTVWMQRISGYPIQVFTGYLDEVPYYQAYPGNAIFSASCTLKKLAYNWFDPGLPVFHNWVRSNPGWEINPATGEAVNRPALFADDEITGSEGFGNADLGDNTTDGGFADLLGRFMVDIAGWDSNDVIIGSLPTNIPRKAAELYNQIEGQTQTNQDDLAKFMSQILGANGWTGGTTSVTESTAITDAHDRSETLRPNADGMLSKIKTVATANNIETVIVVTAALALTSMNPNYHVPHEDLLEYGMGMYAMRPDAREQRGPEGLRTIDGIDVEKIIGDEMVATDVFTKRMNSAAVQGPWVELAKAGDVESMFVWFEKALGRPITPRGNPNALYEQAKKAVASGTTPKPKEVPSPKIDAKNISAFDPQVQRVLSPEERKNINRFYKDAAPEIGSLILMAKKHNKEIIVSFEAGSSVYLPNHLFLRAKPEILESFFNTLKKKNILSSVVLNTGGSDQKILRDGEESNLAPRKLGVVGLFIEANLGVMRDNPSDQDTGSESADEEALGEASLTLGQLAAFSSNAAFAAQFAFPTDIIASMMLTGEKALMNDISCLEAVKQFSQASLRTFRSLPDGRFLAFYPDYFGSQRPPYWQIFNIEIIDFGIQLNDASLATHVYVTGDGGARLGNERAELFSQVATRGVATILQAFTLNSFIEPFDKSDDAPESVTRGLLADPFAFIQHFGYRPHRDEKPLITNAFYEFLMAWQKFMWLWAQQFATMVEFTFQPEVMAGGLIEFPEHDVQMFVESVTHDFDYAGGFTTTAQLSSPSIPKGLRQSKVNMPGFALGGDINTVGVVG